MRSLFGRMSSKHAGHGDPNLPTVSTTEASSSVIDVSSFAWGGYKFTIDPGTITFYTRIDKDDDWEIARDKDKINITETPGVLPLPFNDALFYYNEIKIVSTASLSAGDCRVSLKA